MRNWNELVGQTRLMTQRTCATMTLLAMVASASAATVTWQTTAASGDWSNAANWSGANTPPKSNDSIVFGASTNSTLNNDLTTSAFNVSGITFSANASAYVISGNAFNLTSTGITNNSTQLQTINCDMNMGSSQRTFTLTAGGGNMALGGNVSGTTSMVISGSGTMTLAGNNTFTGGISLGSGRTLNINSNTALGTGVLTSSGGVFDNTSGSKVTVANDFLLNYATTVFTGTNDLEFSTGTITLSSNRTVSVTNSGATLTFGGTIVETGGSRSFAKSGAGLLIMNGNGTYTGGTTVNGGTLRIGNTAALGNSGSAVALSGGGVLEIATDAPINTYNFAVTSSTPVGIIINRATATSGDVAQTIGTLTMNANTLSANAGANVGGKATLAIGAVTIATPAGGTTSFDAATANMTIQSISRTTVDETHPAVLILTGSATGNSVMGSIVNGPNTGSSMALTKNGTGTWALYGSNNYAGPTNINAGTLLVNNTTGSGTGTSNVTVNAGTLGGTGVIAGTTSIGNNSGSADSFIAPGVNGVGMLTLTSTLSMKSDSVYLFEIDSTSGQADQLVAAGVSIAAGASLSASLLGALPLADGIEFIAINNTSANAISGRFSNLSEGGTLMIGGYSFQASYVGGDGNDLTLTNISAPVPEAATLALFGPVALVAGLKRRSRKQKMC